MKSLPGFLASWLIASSEYLRGTAKSDECEPLFKEYKMCLSVRCSNHVAFPASLLTALKKALKERGIDTMLDEARADNRENDAEYMKPSVKSRCNAPLSLMKSYADLPQSREMIEHA